MSLDITSAENALQLKLDALTNDNNVSEFVYAMKAVEQLKSIQITAFDTLDDLPNAGTYIGRIAYVTGETGVYFSNGTRWVAVATSQTPDFTRALLDPVTESEIDYNGVATTATADIDYGAVTDPSVDTSLDYGFDYSNDNAGGAGDIYVDPNDWAFTIYDGSTRRGVKHLRADLNNRNFSTMSANNQGMAQLYKNNNTTTNGSFIAVPMTGTRLNDTRMGALNGDGYYQVNYEGWYEVRLDGHLSGVGWIGFGTVGNYATVAGDVSQGPDEFTMQYVDEVGSFQLVRTVYIPYGTALTPYLAQVNTTTPVTIYGNSEWIAGNVNTAYTYLTQMNIRFLGSNTTTNSYQVSE